MKLPFDRLLAALLATLALAVLVSSWSGGLLDSATRARMETIALAMVLTVAVIVTHLYPIHLRYHTKVSISSIPLYLMAVLLPLPLAMLAAGVGTCVEECLQRARRGSLASDIVTSTSRWMLLVALGAWVVHQPVMIGTGHTLALVATGLVMFAGDLVTNSLHVATMCREPLWRVIGGSAREGGVIEGIQYVLALLGALGSEHQLWAVVLLALPIGIIYLAFKRARELQDHTRQLLESMADAVDLRDPCTGGHSWRVAELCAGILRELTIWGPEADLIIATARVHDVGKISIPDEILRKPGQLTTEERAIMENHADRGADLLARYPDFARGVAIIRHHHERWDGQGYPQGLARHAIPFGARVIAVADSFDAMTSDRPYRRGMSMVQAAQILRDGRDAQWDAEVVDAFLHSIADQLAPEVARDGEKQKLALLPQG